MKVIEKMLYQELVFELMKIVEENEFYEGPDAGYFMANKIVQYLEEQQCPGGMKICRTKNW